MAAGNKKGVCFAAAKSALGDGADQVEACITPAASCHEVISILAIGFISFYKEE